MMTSEKKKAYETIILILNELMTYRESSRNIVLRLSDTKTMEEADEMLRELIRHVRKYMTIEEAKKND